MGVGMSQYVEEKGTEQGICQEKKDNAKERNEDDKVNKR
jgi:hypothetical protein